MLSDPPEMRMEPSMRVVSCLTLAAVMLSTGVSAIAAEQAAAPKSGQGAFNNHCRTCHSVQAGDNRLGPTLHGVIGRKAGAEQGYAAYSGAMKGAGITWDEATLEKFIADPESVVRNNNMKPYKGIPDAKVRKEIVGYLKSIG
jgi:cytochrome c